MQGFEFGHSDFGALNPGFRVLEFGFLNPLSRVLDPGLYIRFPNPELTISYAVNPVAYILNPGYGVWKVYFQVPNPGFRVWDLIILILRNAESRMQDLEVAFQIEGFGFGV